MKRTTPRNSARQQMWRTIRIKRRFELRDLLVTVPGAQASNAGKLLRLLTEGGYVEELPGYVTGRPGGRKGYRLVKDAGPVCPVKSPSAGRKEEQP